MSLRLIRVIDTETTGLPDGDKRVDIVEIGWTDVLEDFSGKLLVVENGWQATLARPTVPITFGAMGVHHITEEMAAAGTTRAAAISMIGGADIYAAHNAAFDQPLLGLDGRIPWICTYKCAHHCWPDMESHSNGALRYALGLCLGGRDADLAQPAHRAGPDTWITAHILQRLSQELTVDQMVKISANPMRLLKMPFGKHKGVRFSEMPEDYLQWMLNSDMASDAGKADVIYSARCALRERRESEGI